MSKLTAPAKVNLKLRVTGRRPDGYHLLEMVMVKLDDLADEIEFEIGENGTSIDAPTIPCDKTNSLWKTADLVRKESGKNFGIKIRLKKNIPVAAGLGGGSSDAASLLLALNRGLHLGWSQQRLIEIGVRIGADVPFFLADGPQRVTGIGEVLEPIAVPSHPVILINPGFPVSTADVYRWWDRESPLPLAGEGAPSEAEGRVRASGALTRFALDAIPSPVENDLERVVIPRYPVLARIKDLLREAGALVAQMSGSGPTVFGIFPTEASQDRGYEFLLKRKDPAWWLWKGKSLGGEESNLD